MKKNILRLVTVIPLMGISLLFSSCSREKTAEKAALPSGHENTVKELSQQNIEESKKVVVAKVNGNDITMKELIDTMNQLGPLYKKDPGQNSPDLDEKVKKESLDLLIFRELALQEAKLQKLKVDGKAVDETINQIKGRAGSEAAYAEYLGKSGQTEETLRKQIERDQLFNMITSREISEKSKVDRQVVRDTYMKEKESYVMPDSFIIQDIFFQTGNMDSYALMKKAEEALALIKKNKNDLSKIPPDNALVFRSGNVTQQEYPKIFKTASGMKAGEVSNVITEGDGLHIFKLAGKEPSRQLTFEEASVYIEQKLRVPLMNKRKEIWEAELKKKAKIEIMNIDDVLPVSALK